jgi:ATP-dependent DNA ligase
VIQRAKDRIGQVFARLLARVQVGITFNEHTDARGELVFRQACAMSLEGIVSKRR